MESNEARDIHITDTIAVGETECFFVQVLGYALQATTGHCFLARIHNGDTPWLSPLMVHLHGIGLHFKSDIRGVQEVVGEILFD